MDKIEIKVKKVRDTLKEIPQRATPGSAGFDLSAAIDKSVAIAPFERVLMPTGIAIELPKGYAAFCFARSGLATKHGLSLANGVGVIDSDYRGEIMVGLINLSDKAYAVEPGERIAQMVVLRTCDAFMIEADELGDTDRGGGGFGSTGTK